MRGQVLTPNIRCDFQLFNHFESPIPAGVTLAELPNEKKAPVNQELEGYAAHVITSDEGYRCLNLVYATMISRNTMS
jgi:hypothetical protein